MTKAPVVTVLIPARNEESDIARCLEAVLAQDYPHDRMEVVLVDGGSTDATAQVAVGLLTESDIDWRIIQNSTGTTPSNLNVGLATATGEYLCRVDARSIVPTDYIRLCVQVLTARSEVLVTGGAQVAIAGDDSETARGIARALNNRLAMGGARYRSAAESGPSDTVYLGAFRTQNLSAVGGWDDSMLTNQDFELNRRLGRLGVVWFDDRLEVGYVPRRSVGALWHQYHRFGRWKVRYWRHTGDPPRPRQWGMMAIVPMGAALAMSCVVSARRRWLVPLGAGLFATLLAAAEAHGTSGPPGRIGARAISSGVMVVVGLAWSSGVWREWVFPDD